MSYVSLQDVDTLLDWSLRAKEYLEGEPFTLRAYNHNTDFVTLDSYVLDSRQKASTSILPDLVISAGSQSTASFKANLFLNSDSQYRFKTRYREIGYEVLLTYHWKSAGESDITVIVTDLSKGADDPDAQIKATGGLFKVIAARHPSGLTATVLANGPILQIGFGDPGR